jgi:hypothetical protein
MSAVLVWAVSFGLSVGAAVLFIPRKLWHRWRDRIVDRLDQALVRKISGFDRRYREHMLGSLRFVDQKGLATVGFHTPELDDVFVDVGLAYRAPHEVPDSVITELSLNLGDRHHLHKLLDKEKPVLLALIGAPGSGKTTLLRFTARQTINNRRGRRRTVPILIYLRDHVTTILANPDMKLASLAAGRLAEFEPPGWFDTRLRSGACLVLLDGLDEIANQENRRSVADWVERQTQLHSKNDFVITSRPQGYRGTPIDGAVVLQVHGFSGEQIDRFVHGWYAAIERRSTGVSDDDTRRRAQESADDLLDRLRAAPALADLTVNPLLLTMIANVHRYRGALPGSRADLYGEICQVMLWRRHEAKRLKHELSGDRKEAILRGLAFSMMRRELQTISREDFVKEVTRSLSRTSGSMTGNDFLDEVSSNGLLLEREAGRYSFAHLTFQEYLAAMHIRDRGLVDVLVKEVDKTWWRDTILLFAARADGDPLVEACLSSGTVTALALAFDIADNGDIEERLRNQLSALLETTDEDPARRSLRNAVRLIRYLRENTIRLGTTARVCGRPISNDIYFSFRADQENYEKDESKTDDPDAPATRIYASDAVRFVSWVNEIIEDGHTYRLPTREEIEEPTIQRMLSGTPWIAEPADGESSRVFLWQPRPNVNPYRISDAVLMRHVRADFHGLARQLSQLVLLQALFHARDYSHVMERNITRTDDIEGEIQLRANALLNRSLRSGDTLRGIDRELARDYARDLDREFALIGDLYGDEPIKDIPLDTFILSIYGLTEPTARYHEFAMLLGGSATSSSPVNSFDDFAGLVDMLGQRMEGEIVGVRGFAKSVRALVAGPAVLARIYAGGEGFVFSGRAGWESTEELNAALRRASLLQRNMDMNYGRPADLALAIAPFLGLRGAPADKMGHALAYTTYEFFRRSSKDVVLWTAEFAETFLGYCHASHDYIVDLDVLVGNLLRARAELGRKQASNRHARVAGTWAETVAANLEHYLLPLLTGRKAIGPETATIARVTALALAAEAEWYAEPEAAELYRHVAAGVTLLERRTIGLAPSDETIVLAVD